MVRHALPFGTVQRLATQSANVLSGGMCVRAAVQGLVPQPCDRSDFPRMAVVNVEVLDRRDVIIGTPRRIEFAAQPASWCLALRRACTEWIARTRGDTGGPVPAVAHPRLYMRPMIESDLPAACALLTTPGQDVACMLPITPEFATADCVGSAEPGSWDALLSEVPRDGLFVIRRKVEQSSASAASASASAARPAAIDSEVADTTKAGRQNALGGDGGEGPLVGVVSLRFNTNVDDSDSSAATAYSSSVPTVHTMDCLVYSAALSKV